MKKICLPSWEGHAIVLRNNLVVWDLMLVLGILKEKKCLAFKRKILFYIKKRMDFKQIKIKK